MSEPADPYTAAKVPVRSAFSSSERGMPRSAAYRAALSRLLNNMTSPQQMISPLVSPILSPGGLVVRGCAAVLPIQ